MKFTLYFLVAILIAPSLAFSEEDGERAIEGYPGWTLELIKPEPSEDGQPNYRTAYFVLKPPDKRPAASITARVAEQVRSGEMGPEAAYNGGSADTVAEKSGTSSSGSSGISGGFGGGGFPASGVSTSLGNYSKVPMAGHSSAAATNDAPAAAAAAPSPDARNSSGSSATGSDSASTASPISISVDNAKGGAMGSTTTTVVAQCQATTVENCSVSGSGGGICSSGFTGSCSYTCNNGAWTKAQNSCSIAQVKACNSIEECMHVAGAQYNLIGDTQGFIDSNAGYICQKLGKSHVVSATTSQASTINPNGIRLYMVSLCANGGGCQNKYYFMAESYGGLSRGFDGDYLNAKAVSSVVCQ